MKKLLLLLISCSSVCGDSLSVVDTEAVGGIKAWLIGIGISR